MAWCLSHPLYFRIQPSSSYSKEGLVQASAQVANSCSLNKGSLSRWLQALCVRMLLLPETRPSTELPAKGRLAVRGTGFHSSAIPTHAPLFLQVALSQTWQPLKREYARLFTLDCFRVVSLLSLSALSFSKAKAAESKLTSESWP